MKAFASLAAATALLVAPLAAHADPIPLARVNERIDAVTPKVVQWRRDIHANPELANSEVRTARLVAAHLKRLGFEVRERVAHTGVIGVLRGGKPGPVVALRADMDALPVLEQTGLPFASKAKGMFNGAETPVAHACGHDLHVAMLMGAAEVLASMKADIPGTIVFIFQPAEEGPPSGEQGGAPMMIAEGALANPAPAAIFGLHVGPGVPGSVYYRPEGFMAAADRIEISLKGRQTHGAWPSQGIDIISLSSAIISEINTIAARTVDVTATPTVLTIATIHAGVRYNIIPEDLVMTGTMRTFNTAQRDALQQRITTTVNNLSASYGARAEVKYTSSGKLTFNDVALSRAVLPALQEAAGAANVNSNARPTTVSEDFSSFQEKIPGVFYFLGASADGVDPATTPPNHSPLFSPNEKILPLGVRTHVLTALRYLEANAGAAQAPAR